MGSSAMPGAPTEAKVIWWRTAGAGLRGGPTSRRSRGSTYTGGVSRAVAWAKQQMFDRALSGHQSHPGHAERTTSQLTAEQWELLAAVPFARTTLKGLIEHWADTAKKLGDVEMQRARLRDAEVEGPANEREAKTQWLRAINALITVADLAELSEADDALLFNELRVAEERADERNRRQSEEEPTPEEPSDAQVSEQAPTPDKLRDEKGEEASADEPDSVAS